MEEPRHRAHPESAREPGRVTFAADLVAQRHGQVLLVHNVGPRHRGLEGAAASLSAAVQPDGHGRALHYHNVGLGAMLRLKTAAHNGEPRHQQSIRFGISGP